MYILEYRARVNLNANQMLLFSSVQVLDLTTSCDDDDDEFDEFNFGEDDDDNDDIN